MGLAAEPSKAALTLSRCLGPRPTCVSTRARVPSQVLQQTLHTRGVSAVVSLCWSQVREFQPFSRISRHSLTECVCLCCLSANHKHDAHPRVVRLLLPRVRSPPPDHMLGAALLCRCASLLLCVSGWLLSMQPPSVSLEVRRPGRR